MPLWLIYERSLLTNIQFSILKFQISPKTRLRLRSATLAWPKTKDLPSPSSYLNALMVNHSVLPTYKLSILNFQISNYPKTSLLHSILSALELHPLFAPLRETNSQFHFFRL